jgi:hypothetical protein
MIFGCPGAERFKQTIPEDIACPCCGEELEIWSDEVKVACFKCKTMVIREQRQSCLDWCKFARECVGEAGYNKYLKNQSLVLKHKISGL